MPELVPLLAQLPWLDQAVRLLDFDPDLAPGLAGQALAAAASQCVARARLLPRATWLDPAELESGGIGLFMLRGLILRWTRVGSGTSAELLGPGDLLRPGAHDDLAEVRSAVRWQVAEPALVAVLDRDFHRRAARWPELLEALLLRMDQRADSLTVRLAAIYERRLPERIHLVMWHLADRWGRVEPGGVALSLGLPHHVLACLVGAQRSSVTRALGELELRGSVECRGRGRWLLRHGPFETHRPVAS